MKRSINPVLAALAASATGMFLHAAPANADINQARCSFDTLLPGEAQMRLEWARRCGTKINIVTPNNPAAGKVLDTGLVSANGVEEIEYSETTDFWGKNSYSGNNNGYINTINTQYQYAPFPSAVTATNDVNGFQKWTRPTVLARPLYPTFANNFDIVNNPSIPLFPNPKYKTGDFSDCKLYTDLAGTIVADTSVSGFYVSGFCTSSCYTPDQAVSFVDGKEKIIDAITAQRPTGLMTVTPNSTLDKIRFQADDVATYTRELRDDTNVIYEIHTASGGQLRVTDKHPVIIGNGRIVEASTLKVGNRLIKADGTRDRIVSITKSNFFGKVYNIKPKSTNLTANILVAQGFLVGSSRYQNEDVDFINRLIFNRRIPREVIPQ